MRDGIMGCISSKKDINDIHPNIFQVTNVDDSGRAISPGQLEVTETELVFYQRGKSPTRWPLRCLRKYGFDIEIFSFECGRRCPTGHGIYAFHCLKAEQLFNVVQQNIQLRNLADDNLQISDFPVPLTSTGPPVHRRTSQADSYLNPGSSQPVRVHPSLSRPGSISSNGPISPPAMSPLSVTESSFEQNNNKRDSSVVEQPYTNTNVTMEEHIYLPSYINITMVNSPSPDNYVNVQEQNSHLYMNISCNDTNTESRSDQFQDISLDYAGHCYANVDASDLENLKLTPRNVDLESAPPTPTSLYESAKEVNYAELDLPSNSSTTQLAPDSPVKIKKSYVTIDFNRTNALSQSINSRIDLEEGSRKTRHNSTISDVPTRHSSSLSD
ncbi:hypothetical protein AMK59_4016 [Oryctes borbonicus]|uniref:IRS-type PTB domain-containing protein n=1 Tax=Oryctes borbonicus TaxID=1629725 RepID=A0A0T6B7I5_9SCAR|nr:hypothetical protein AMK59_4016 [Oryctes borbonicus]